MRRHLSTFSAMPPIVTSELGNESEIGPLACLQTSELIDRLLHEDEGHSQDELDDKSSGEAGVHVVSWRYPFSSIHQYGIDMGEMSTQHATGEPRNTKIGSATLWTCGRGERHSREVYSMLKLGMTVPALTV